MPKKVLIDFDLNNSSQVINMPDGTASHHAVNLSQMNTAISGIVSGYIAISSIDDLADVDTTTEAPVEDQSLIWDGGNWVPGSPEVLVEVKNPSATTAIAKGTPVYVSGDSGPSGKPEVTAAQSDSTTTMPAIGLMHADLAAETEGHVVVQGMLLGVDTDTPGWDAGTALYVDPASAGTLTSTRPTGGTQQVQKVGLVTRRHVSAGSILVIGAGRTNDVPNELTTLTGVALDDTNLGTFTGTTIADNETIKGALQDLETAVESAGGGGDPDWKVTTYSSQDYVVLDAADSSSTQTNVPVVVQPKGTGAFMLNEPDGTAAGGNPRGDYAVDLTLFRSLNSEVAGGLGSITIGRRARALGADSIAIGFRANNSNANATGSILIGQNEAGGSRGDNCVLIGQDGTAYWEKSTQIGSLNRVQENYTAFGSSRPRETVCLGNNAMTQQPGGIAINSGKFLSGTNTQRSIPVRYVERAMTTDATATKLFFQTFGGNTYGMQLWNDSLHQANLMINALSDGGEWATFQRHVVATRGSDYSTVVLQSATTIGTDRGSNSGSPPSGWSVSIAVQSANVEGQGNVYVTVRGAAATNVRWICNWDSLQVQYDYVDGGDGGG